MLHHKPPLASKKLQNNRHSKSLWNLEVTFRLRQNLFEKSHWALLFLENNNKDKDGTVIRGDFRLFLSVFLK